MGVIDLHIHTTASDGTFTPSQIVEKSAALGMKYIAISDHDTVGGVAEALKAARAFPGLTVIPGLEINTDIDSGEAHVLGYFLDYHDETLTEQLRFLSDSRDRRAQKMIEKLAGLGIIIDWERVREIAGEGTVGRPHIAQALIEKGYINAFDEAFTKYIGQGCPAYVERVKLSPVEAVNIITAARGIAVLAHPFSAGPKVRSMVKELAAAGLSGLEVYYAEYSASQVAELEAICRDFKLIATGGTDFHGISTRLEGGIGAVYIPDKVIDRLLLLAQQKGFNIVSPDRGGFSA